FDICQRNLWQNKDREFLHPMRTTNYHLRIQLQSCLSSFHQSDRQRLDLLWMQILVYIKKCEQLN
ncbi:hypothetical protein, partial [Fischerella sp.]|uniref:hypothetical protein n=1 Tax=Fischerella sp. TaxID=1191 RepID=UPI0025B90CE7